MLRKTRTLALIISLMALAGLGAWAFHFLVRPAQRLDVAKAMRIAFGVYNPEHGGLLSPQKLTGSWQIKQADHRTTPLLFQVYEEAERPKAVLVTQTQYLEGGEPYVSHAQTAELSVFVFAQKRGTWYLEKRSGKALEAGSYGEGPQGKLIRTGPDKFGLLFHEGYLNMGNGSLFVSLLDISGPTIDEPLTVQTEEDNAGNCSSDPDELKEPGFQPCWSWKTRLGLHLRQSDDHYVLKAVRSGTREDWSNGAMKVVPNAGVTYYTFQGSSYRETHLDPSILGPEVDEPALALKDGP